MSEELLAAKNTKNAKEKQGMEQYFFRASAADFNKIPGSPIVYWASEKILDLFQSSASLSDKIETREGLTTGSNDLFLRLWHEVQLEKIGFGIEDNNEAQRSQKRYFTYIKGGDFRRWSGNLEYIVNWLNDGEELKVFKDPATGRVRSHNYNGDYAFRTGFTWSGISSGTFAVRHVPTGFMFDAKGPMGFAKDLSNQPLHEAFLNSAVTNHLIKMLAPTLDFKLGHILNLPVAGNVSRDICQTSKSAVQLSTRDWNSYETSWDFTSLPLLNPDFRQPTLKATYQKLRAHWREMTLEMQRLEEENNRIFIDAYGLQEELTPEVPLNEITLTCNPWYRYGKGSSQPSAISHQQNGADAFTDGCKLTADGFPEDPELEARLQQDTMRELVSYAVGCMMGRYALEKPGLILADARASQSAHLQAHAEQVGPREAQRFPVDEDGILPLLDDEWFSDDVTARFTEFLRVTWGPESLSANLRLVEESLGKPIRKYLLTDFWKDHLQRYRKRPIYWLVQSPKRGFQALIYLHRYTHDTFHQVLNDYLREYLNKLRARQETLQLELASGGRASVQKELNRLEARLHELESWEREVLLPLAQQRLEIDLDDGVKVNYPKFGAALASIPGL
jgi:hypothetical protein